ncbi:MAG: 6-phosphogluconolactonase [Verrucomicrobia bacterium]|nr:6-phosphogluconolactonase [Verrucomicrobiota bacterium]
MAREIIRTQQFAADAARFIIDSARRALAERGEFRLALSGGNTPRPVYASLAPAELPWEKMVITFGDERCVPPDDDQSNYKMANETLLEPAHVPPSSVLRMRGEIAPPLAADEYQQQLDTLAAQRGEPLYRHDLILLGIGDDGHTASLFPGTPALEELSRRVAANYVPKLQSWRLTFTFPLIFAAREICFLVNANKPQSLIDRIFSGDDTLPAARVDREANHVTWIFGEAQP